MKKLNLAYLTHIHGYGIEDNTFVLNTNCSWSCAQVGDQLELVKGFWDSPLGPLVFRMPSPLTKGACHALSLKGHDIKINEVSKCRDGIGWLINFTII